MFLISNLFYTFQDVNFLVVFLAQIDIPTHMAQLQLAFLRKLMDFVKGILNTIFFYYEGAILLYLHSIIIQKIYLFSLI